MGEAIHAEIMDRDRRLVEGVEEEEVTELMRMLEIVYRNLSN